MTPVGEAPAELWRMSATELAEAIRSRQVSSREVIEAHLRRIEAVDPAVNAVPVVLGEQALDAADAADRAVAAGGDLPPLHGVPFVVKPNIDVAGTPTTQGLTVFADAYPQIDAPIVERMKAAANPADHPYRCALQLVPPGLPAFEVVLMEFGDYPQMRRMLLSIKQRAESTPRPAAVPPLEVSRREIAARRDPASGPVRTLRSAGRLGQAWTGSNGSA